VYDRVRNKNNVHADCMIIKRRQIYRYNIIVPVRRSCVYTRCVRRRAVNVVHVTRSRQGTAGNRFFIMPPPYKYLRGPWEKSLQWGMCCPCILPRVECSQMFRVCYAFQTIRSRPPVINVINQKTFNLFFLFEITK